MKQGLLMKPTEAPTHNSKHRKWKRSKVLPLVVYVFILLSDKYQMPFRLWYIYLHFSPGLVMWIYIRKWQIRKNCSAKENRIPRWKGIGCFIGLHTHLFLHIDVFWVIVMLKCYRQTDRKIKRKKDRKKHKSRKKNQKKKKQRKERMK